MQITDTKHIDDEQTTCKQHIDNAQRTQTTDIKLVGNAQTMCKQQVNIVQTTRKHSGNNAQM